MDKISGVLVQQSQLNETSHIFGKNIKKNKLKKRFSYYPLLLDSLIVLH